MKQLGSLIRNVKKLQEVNPALCSKLKSYVFDIIGCCMEVHRDMGPWLNEYMYQEALAVVLKEKSIAFQKEYYFSVDFHGERIAHKHYVDFLVKEKVFVECKAIDHIGAEQRQQLWNYMRLAKVRIGILYNFAPFNDECEKYYLDTDNQMLYAF